MFWIIYGSAEMWPSGRRRSPAKGVGPEGSRGFESLRLRHLTNKDIVFNKQNVRWYCRATIIATKEHAIECNEMQQAATPRHVDF